MAMRGLLTLRANHHLLFPLAFRCSITLPHIFAFHTSSYIAPGNEPCLTSTGSSLFPPSSLSFIPSPNPHLKISVSFRLRLLTNKLFLSFSGTTDSRNLPSQVRLCSGYRRSGDPFTAALPLAPYRKNPPAELPST